MTYVTAFLNVLAKLPNAAWGVITGGFGILLWVLEKIDDAHDWMSKSKPIKACMLIFSIWFGSFSVYDGLNIFDHGIALVVPADTKSYAAGGFARMQFEFLVDDISTAIDCNVTVGRKTMRRKIDNFVDERDDQLKDADFHKTVDEMFDGLKQTRYHKLVGIVLVGAADERPLSPAARRLGFKSNDDLAYRRASQVKAEIVNHLGVSAPPAMIVVLRAAEIEASGHSAQELAPDRAVEVCVIWGV